MQPSRPSRGASSLVGVLIVAAIASFAVVVFLPPLLPHEELKGAERSAEIGRNRTAVLAFFAGLLALAGAAFTGLNFQLSRRGQMTERFFRAVEQLGKEDQAALRLAAVYELEAIASESGRDLKPVVNVLDDFVQQQPAHIGERSSAAVYARSVHDRLRPLAEADDASFMGSVAKAISTLAVAVGPAGITLSVGPELIVKRDVVPDEDVAQALEEFTSAWRAVEGKTSDVAFFRDTSTAGEAERLQQAAAQLIEIRDKVALGR